MYKMFKIMFTGLLGNKAVTGLKDLKCIHLLLQYIGFLPQNICYLQSTLQMISFDLFVRKKSND